MDVYLASSLSVDDWRELERKGLSEVAPSRLRPEYEPTAPIRLNGGRGAYSGHTLTQSVGEVCG